MARILMEVLVLIFSIPVWLHAFQEDVPLYLMGRAVLDDGTPFSASIKVEMVCDGRVVRQSFVNEKGVFSFDLGSVNQAQGVGDAGANPSTGGLDSSFARSAWNNAGFPVIRGRVFLDHCQVRLQQNPEYSSTEIQLGVRGLLDDPDIGAILVTRRKAGAPATVDISRAPIPPEAEEASAKAVAELEKSKPNLSNAAKNLQKAVEIHPEFDAAWALLGEVRMEQGKLKEAEEAFSRAAKVNPAAVKPRLGLAQLALEGQQWNEASMWAQQALDLEPGTPRGLLYSGLASYYKGDYQVAMNRLENLEEAGKADSFPVSLLHLGMLYAMRGDVPEAAQRLRRYLEVEDESSLQASRRTKIESQLKTWEEQGLIAP